MILAIGGVIVAFVIAQIYLKRIGDQSKTLNSPKGDLIIINVQTEVHPKNYQASENDLNNWPPIIYLAWKRIQPNGKLSSQGEFNSISGNNKLEIENLRNDLFMSAFIVGHNIRFHYAILYADLKRNNYSVQELQDLTQICTMMQSKEYCKISGGRGYKYPKLNELYEKLFRDFIPSNESKIETCLKCFKKLFNLNIIRFDKAGNFIKH